MDCIILHLETTGLNCSVALSKGRKRIAHRAEMAERFIHSERLHVFIDEVMQESGLTPTDLNAVSVSRGPGSYTGLRIGSSAAKGLCFALGVPLIAVDTCRILECAMRQMHTKPTDFFVPLMDARRMEVYTATFDASGQEIEAVHPLVWEEQAFAKWKDQTIVFGGDGAAKCAEVTHNNQWTFLPPIYPDAKYMVDLSVDAFEASQFEDVAYFEPEYLKAFVAGKPKNMLNPVSKNPS
ncbi:MAG: tRNA (adenosine(37)-N6)-threonylcarbamoyltransferase complex dimerization subunit type 1 TsaB [Flavobacteriales bacterium]|nr:tRNA (adenosine(37)-N6)-threonylcarbamoyltransferase complex dimerization subunit type 1 TsaB [Flavobacteriales bacterium]